MPYAWVFEEWLSGKNHEMANAETANTIMSKTKRQLHQGRHKEDPYPDKENTDWKTELEEDDKIHEPQRTGYLNMVEKLLDIIVICETNHVKNCPICRPDEKSNEIYPSKAIVRHMNQVSGLIKLFIDTNHIYVSVRAHQWGRYSSGGRKHKDENPLTQPAWLNV